MSKTEKEQMWELFKSLGAKALTLNHYDLAKLTSIKEVQLWKDFLTDPEVSSYIEQETQIITQTELRKLTTETGDSRSVGQAQLINAMSKATETKGNKEGPIFIYTYVPLSENQHKAANTRALDVDIFEKVTDKVELKKVETEEPKDTKTMTLNNNEVFF